MSMFLIVAAGAFFTIYKARQAVAREVQSSVNLALQSLDSGLAESLKSNNPLNYWQQRMAVHGQTRHLKIDIETSTGGKLSFPDFLPPADHEEAPAWFVWMVHSDPIRVARRVETPGGWINITLNDEPNDEITEAWGEARGFLLLVVLQAILVFVLVHVTIGRALRSVPVILKGFEGLEAGQYQLRLPEFSLPEFSRIANAFNHAASTLETAHAENKALAARSLTLQEEERRILSQELHDELGQSLTGIKVISASMRQNLPVGKSAQIDSIINICDHLFGVVRSMMRRLRPTMLEDLGLGASVEDMLSNWQQQNHPIRVDVDFDPRVDQCSANLQIQLYRILQESLSNIARHSDATRVTIQLVLLDQCSSFVEQSRLDGRAKIRLTVSDNGSGCELTTPNTGFGLMGIRERVQTHSGHYEIQSNPGEGFRLVIELPFQQEESP